MSSCSRALRWLTLLVKTTIRLSSPSLWTRARAPRRTRLAAGSLGTAWQTTRYSVAVNGSYDPTCRVHVHEHAAQHPESVRAVRSIAARLSHQVLEDQGQGGTALRRRGSRGRAPATRLAWPGADKSPRASHDVEGIDHDRQTARPAGVVRGPAH